MDRDPIITVRNLSHVFDEGLLQKEVLHQVSVDFFPGEIIIITGPSGSGKTTFLTLVGALRSVQTGDLMVNGQGLRDLSGIELMHVRRHMGFIFQAHNLIDALTACENVQIALVGETNETAESARKKALECLTEVGLKDYAYKKPRQLSGGQKQRVAIARALVRSPKIILADEPTAALDKKSGREIVDLLYRLAKRNGCTILLVTHDNRILDVADRIINIVDGSFVSNVSVEESVEICEYLVNCPVFSNNPPATLTEISQKMIIEKYSANSLIIRQGDIGEKFYILRKGMLEVFMELDGKEQLIATLKPGEFFGEIALLEDCRRTATVRASEDSDVYALNKQDFLDSLKCNETFRKQLLEVFFKRR